MCPVQVLPYAVEQQMQECQQLRGMGGGHLRDRTSLLSSRSIGQ